MGDQQYMDIAHAGLKTQPFLMHGEAASVVHYQAEQSAHNYLRMIAAGNRGIGVMFGPDFSGKRTIIFQFVASLPSALAVAVVDGTKLNVAGLLDAIRSQFNYEPESSAAENSLNELQEYILQQARESRIPLLVIENFNKMYPSALRALCVLADLKIQGRFALRMVLTSSRPAFNIIHAPAMSAIAARTISSFEMGPMTPAETSSYLHEKLRSAGCDAPESAIPQAICDELYSASRGLPGILDNLVMKAIERAEHWPLLLEHIFPSAVDSPVAPAVAAATEPAEGTHTATTSEGAAAEEAPQAEEAAAAEEVSQAEEAAAADEVLQAEGAAAADEELQAEEAAAAEETLQAEEAAAAEEVSQAEETTALVAASRPALTPVRDSIAPDMQKLYLTLNRETLQEFELSDSKTLIGRSEICDITVHSRFVSKYHALLIRKDDAMLLLDLNSTNGTFINSRRIDGSVLRHEDVISLGNHGIKLIAPAYRSRDASEAPDLTETAVMQTLDDLRPAEEGTSDDAVVIGQQEA